MEAFLGSLDDIIRSTATYVAVGGCHNQPLAPAVREFVDLYTEADASTPRFLPRSVSYVDRACRTRVDRCTQLGVHIRGPNGLFIRVRILDRARSDDALVSSIDLERFRTKALCNAGRLAAWFSNETGKKVNSDSRMPTEDAEPDDGAKKDRPDCTIWFLPLAIKKQLPRSASIAPAPRHANSAFFVPWRSAIMVLREEEHAKVILHEVLHYLIARSRRRSAHSSHSSLALGGRALEAVNISNGTILRLEETIVEAFAVIFHAACLAASHTSCRRNGLAAFNAMVAREGSWCRALSIRILQQYRWPHRPWSESSNLFAYVVLRTHCMVRPSEFLTAFRSMYGGGSTEPMRQFMEACAMHAPLMLSHGSTQDLHPEGPLNAPNHSTSAGILFTLYSGHSG